MIGAMNKVLSSRLSENVEDDVFDSSISSELFCGIFWKSFNALSTLKESSHSEKLDVAFWNGFVEMERKKKKGETLNCEGNIKASGIDNFNYGSSSNCLKGGTIGIEGFVVQFSRRIHLKAVKAPTDNFCAYINLWLILFSSIVQLSAIPSVWAAGGMMESWGRKPVLILGSILQLVGSILLYWFPNDVVASIGLTIIGCSVALLNQAIPIILNEINIGKAPKWISLVYNSMVLWGSTSTKAVNMAASHNFHYGWRWSFATSGFLALPLLVLSFFLSETPRFLIKKGRMEEAKASLKMLRKCGAEAELQMLAGVMENEGKRKRKKLSRSPLLLLNIVAQIFQQVLGLDSILFFGPFILQSAGYAYNASFVAPLIAGVIRAGVAGLTYPSYSYFGRRRTLVSACLGMVVAQVSLLGIFLLVGDRIFHLSQKSAYVGMAFAIPLIGCYSMFSGPSGWTEESYAEEIRVLGACWETSISLLMSLIMNPAILMLLCALKAGIFILFAALTLGMCFSIYKFLPEKDGEGVEEDLFKQHWFWKRFLPKDGNIEAVMAAALCLCGQIRSLILQINQLMALGRFQVTHCYGPGSKFLADYLANVGVVETQEIFFTEVQCKPKPH
ncbi:sugar transport protein MST4-like [Nicotiana tabacum]|uniref:Sugar transport protein MST4-like n=1 Tax=Nicotiana tabacum TaxID=4097 RepID=A0AC58SEM3_TOBAC